MTPILVENRTECEAALKAAQESNLPLICFTPVGFANYAGLLYAREMWRQARASCPSHPATFWLDCAEDAAMVQEALRHGLTHLVFHGPTELFVKLSSIAAQYDGAQLRQDRPTIFTEPSHIASCA